MEKFLSELGTINWWISVVAVGLILNIIAGFAFKYISSFLDKFSQNRRAEKLNLELDELKRIKELEENDVEKVIQSSIVLFLTMNVIIHLLYSIFCLLIMVLLLTVCLFENVSKETLLVILLPFFLIVLYYLFSVLRYINKSNRENSILQKSRRGNVENSTTRIS